MTRHWPLLLACDASRYDVGAVLSQIDDQGREAAIAQCQNGTKTKKKKDVFDWNKNVTGTSLIILFRSKNEIFFIVFVRGPRSADTHVASAPQIFSDSQREIEELTDAFLQ